MKLEGEALLLGIWKNVSELEECLTISELELIVSTMREKEDRQARWLAAVNGIDLNSDSNGETPEEKVERLKRQADAIREGTTGEQFEYNELGLDIEVDNGEDSLESLGIDVEIE